MKKIKLIIAICISVSFFMSCEKEDVTSKVVFRNRSVNNYTFNVVWDGSVIKSLYPQEDSDTITATPGEHTLVFKIANTGAAACIIADPKLDAGYTHTFTCSQ